MHTNSEHYELHYGSVSIPFSVERRRRKTLSISVLPDSSVQVIAPLDAESELILQRVGRRAAWIVRRQEWFARFRPHTPERHYLSGETHRYLGRRYRLKVVEGSPAGVHLRRGLLELVVATPANSTAVRSVLLEWYRRRAQHIFADMVAGLCERYAIATPPTLQVRTMKTRWGSLSPSGLLTLNLHLVQAPKECIDYVITHELCHLHHHNHSPNFYRLLTQRMPDWQRRKQKLEEAMT